MRRWIVIAGLVLGAFVMGVLALLPERKHPSRTPTTRAEAMIGPAGGVVGVEGLRVTVPRNALREPTTVRIERLTDQSTDVYEAATAPLGAPFEVQIAARLRAPIKLTFLDSAIAQRRHVVVAHRPDGSAHWELIPGQRTGGGLVVETAELSPLQVRSGDLDFGPLLKGGKRKVQEGLGTRSKPLACEPPTGVTIRDDDGDDPLLYACRETLDSGETALRVRNNRGVGLEFDPPDGVRIAEIKGRSVGEAAFDEINAALSKLGPTGNGRLLPGGGGEVLLTGDLTAAEVKFRITTTGLVGDALLLFAPKEETVEALVAAVSCAFTSGDRGARPTEDSIKDIIVECATGAFSAAGQAGIGLVIAAPSFGAALGDVLGDFGRNTTVTVEAKQAPPPEPPGPSLRLSGPITTEGIAPVRVGMLPGEVEEATGLHLLPIGEANNGCAYFQFSPGMAGASEKSYLPGARLMVTGPDGAGVLDLRERGEVARVDVDKPGYTTREGVQVGDSEADVRAAYGARLRIGPHEYEPKGHYMIVTTATGRRIIFETNGRTVTLIRAGRSPEVDFVEGCS